MTTRAGRAARDRSMISIPKTRRFLFTSRAAPAPTPAPCQLRYRPYPCRHAGAGRRARDKWDVRRQSIPSTRSPDMRSADTPSQRARWTCLRRTRTLHALSPRKRVRRARVPCSEHAGREPARERDRGSSKPRSGFHDGQIATLAKGSFFSRCWFVIVDVVSRVASRGPLGWSCCNGQCSLVSCFVIVCSGVRALSCRPGAPSCSTP
jgi:hypothetical protein